MEIVTLKMLLIVFPVQMVMNWLIIDVLDVLLDVKNVLMDNARNVDQILI